MMIIHVLLLNRIKRTRMSRFRNGNTNIRHCINPTDSIWNSVQHFSSQKWPCLMYKPLEKKHFILIQEPLFLSVINATKENMHFPVNILKPALCNVIFFLTFKHFVVFQINNEFIISIKSVRFNKE